MEPTPAPGSRDRNRRGKRRRLIAIGLGAGLLVGGALFSVLGPARNDQALVGGELTYRVKKGDLRISFTERGNIKAARSEPIYCRLEGMHTIVTIVPEGANVKAGDVLVELDASELQQLLNQQQIAVDSAAADYLQAQEQLEIQRSLAESEIQKCALDVELATLDLQKYKASQGEYALSLMKADADVTIAQQELKRAQNTVEWTRKLAEKGYVSGTELIADELAEQKAKIQLEQGLGSKRLLEEFTHKKDMAKYEATLREAQSAQERSERKSKATLAQYEAAKRGKESTMNLSKRRLVKLQDQLEKATIRAPQDGMVVYPPVEPWRRERIITQGAEVHENQLLMNLPDVSTMAIDVQVHESWIDQVRVGLPSLAGIDALPNLSMKGSVTKVGLLPDSVNRWLNPDLKVYETEITLESSPDVALLRPGMSAKVEILIAVLNEVLFVPVQSVSRVDKQQVCYLLENGEFVARPVECGRFNDAFYEIRSGIKEGDVIQLNAPAPKGTKGHTDDKEMAELARQIEAVDSRPSGPRGSRGGPGSRPGGENERGEDQRRSRRDAKAQAQPGTPESPAAGNKDKDGTTATTSPATPTGEGETSRGGAEAPRPTALKDRPTSGGSQ